MNSKLQVQVCGKCRGMFFIVMLGSDDNGRQKEAELTCVKCKGRKSFELKVEE